MNKTLNVAWCDDIRNEVGNKASLIGVYQSELLIPQPSTLAKFCAYITIRLPADEDFSKGSIKIVDGSGNELVSINDIAGPDSNVNSESKGKLLVVAIIISPFAIDEATKYVMVTAQLDGEILTSEKLYIKIG